MSEAQVNCTINIESAKPSSIPRDIFNFWRRLLKLPRGRVYNIVMMIPEKDSEPVTWAFMGDGKEENKA